MKPLLLGFDGLLGPGVGGFTSTRQGGRSTGAFSSLNLGTNTGDDPTLVLANRRDAFDAAGLDAAQGVFLEQVHGSRIEEAKIDDAGRGLSRFEEGLPGTDAVFTRQRGLALSIGHADCLAVVLVDGDMGLLGLAHAGWRGALAKLPLKLAEAMIKAGAESSRLRVLLSPCLSPAGLELSEEQYRAFAGTFDDLDGIASPLRQGKFHLDLRAAVSAPLLALGVPGAQIVSQALYSDAQEELFFSYRRDQATTGRMLTTAFLK